MIECELAPSLFLVALMICIGSYDMLSLFVTGLVCALSAFLFTAYQSVNLSLIRAGRTFIFMMTCILFVMVMADDHVFSDSTLP